MTELSRILDKQIHTISEMPDDDLNNLVLTIERAYVHALIEKTLRSPIQEEVGVSRVKKRLRGG